MKKYLIISMLMIILAFLIIGCTAPPVDTVTDEVGDEASVDSGDGESADETDIADSLGDLDDLDELSDDEDFSELDDLEI